MTTGWVVGLLATVLLAIAVAVLSILVLTSDDDTLVLDLAAGDCFELPEELAESTITNVETVDCDQPHEAEVFATGLRNPDRDVPYPDEDELFRVVDARCAAVLADLPGASERFGVLPVIPNESSWDPFRGRFVCVAIPYGGGTVIGSIGA